MAIPIPEFKVLLSGPGLPAVGRQAHARFEGSVLTLIAPRTMVMVAAQDISLATGGYDGRQWTIRWKAREGDYSALLQGDGALQAFIAAAPREVGAQLRRSRASQKRKTHPWRAGLALLLLALGGLMVYGLLAYLSD